MRIGQGFDAHSFETDSRLVLGGVEIPHNQGLKAHSDGDVLTHALCDALLGAAGLGDIGQHFPDSDSVYADIDSRVLLRRVVELLFSTGWQLVNTDLIAVVQRPKLAPHIAAMREHLAEDLRVTPGRVNIKATTTEGMGFTGRGDGIAAFAIVLLEEYRVE
ncbi:MAG: 2-C-methyl-D-erythritol 2,4-cyclodiphosphate synthase [Candidatus Thiodiazotropha sp. (ex Lucinoma aequizonata)]|nr:2-C-methyl-D-erythritol 2,4-cyclodiphosphate synthase [Candidatus Thiodiazotropha sp. (ex Lucinoma aequizonata)]MCU7895598.1 2-C-methyl-D-erythritol 2,4-cyclodiphosphate synthase [Candidatus Thiodiazotropha sp. (ex Lucinoma aequizonata)]MCU7899502.1 2-C-methyl-D-erythritol 2,4-cyclodiphosphate synthase [Candidatus Thiodiazotropha sp. (ex Lucinoma aequizonata)]MCU7900639.1 2-C-methyl-D-erythritol 2,4-cyclodiphosphate synthase [Candidatus Thiodiazotropha sp. (ex Lucinoma aequizonata)]MCU790884